MSKKPNRIADLRAARGMTQEELAQAIDSFWTTISRIENKPLNLRNKTVLRIAEVLQVQPHELMQPSGGESITVCGKVEAGAWADHAQWPDEDHYQISIPEIPGYAGTTKFGSEVHGNSMNELYPDGSIVIWIPFLSNPELPKAGRRYLVERQRHGEYEVTLKEYHIDQNGNEWLIPRTNDPSKKQPIPIVCGDGENIRIVGRIIWSIRSEES